MIHSLVGSLFYLKKKKTAENKFQCTQSLSILCNVKLARINKAKCLRLHSQEVQRKHTQRQA